MQQEQQQQQQEEEEEEEGTRPTTPPLQQRRRPPPSSSSSRRVVGSHRHRRTFVQGRDAPLRRLTSSTLEQQQPLAAPAHDAMPPLSRGLSAPSRGRVHRVQVQLKVLNVWAVDTVGETFCAELRVRCEGGSGA
jgi:hypothetical protein